MTVEVARRRTEDREGYTRPQQEANATGDKSGDIWSAHYYGIK